MTVPWSHYEIMLAIRGDAPVPRMAYLEGTLELMSPSKDHESIKSILNLVILTYAADIELDLRPVGSWTVKDARVERGVEPDECYTVGSFRGRTEPDLAIEVIWTHGGLDKLEIYRELGVNEVWFWQNGQITVHRLGADGYEIIDRSALLPDLDLAAVAAAATLESPTQALAALRATYSA